MSAPTPEGIDEATATPSAPALVLRLWGIDEAHIRDAQWAFGIYPSRDYWTITDTEVSQSPVSPIRNFDPDAVAQDADFGWAWAVYRAGARQVPA
jgi:hypothetical protein